MFDTACRFLKENSFVKGREQMDYYAHSATGCDKSKWQKLREHLESVAELAGSFAAKFNAYQFGYVAGMFHDIGKYSIEFQQRLEGANIKVDHSTAGAKEAVRLYGNALGIIFAYVIAGHHNGLPDFGSKADEKALVSRLEKEKIPDFSAYKTEIVSVSSRQCLQVPVKLIHGQKGFSLAFFIRMIYSCLVDADFMDTEQAMSNDSAVTRGGFPDVETLLGQLNRFLLKKCTTSPTTNINKYRTEILRQCCEKAGEPTQFFTLTVPTGGGKTLSSLAFALHHAKIHGLERVVYVIPYTSIIEQNAQVFRDVLGNSCVLEHHSNFQYKDDESEDYTEIAQKLLLSSENWDVPVIVTTNVQFFESLFANRSSKCRKLHNLSRSVIVLDEAQMLPVNYLKPCLAALSELVTNYGSSVVLCTATQPALTGFIPGNVRPVEIIGSPEQLYKCFRRVTVKNIGSCDDAGLAGELLKYEQVLCIVNTRRHAQMLYQRIKENSGTFHLSARMCPLHRAKKLARIRDTLKQGGRCRVISTQLIEAGVDIDFPVVYRSLAGIDSIAQAAGRCNREGKIKNGQVFIFSSLEKHGQPKGWLSRTAAVAEMILRRYSDPLSLEAVNKYFELLYDLEGTGLDQKRILDQFEENAKVLGFPFLEVADKFKIIENDMYPIIIPYDEHCIKLLNQIKWSPYPVSLARHFQPYAVSVYNHEFMQLARAGLIETINGTFHVLSEPSCYCENMGLMIEGDGYSVEEVLVF